MKSPKLTWKEKSVLRRNELKHLYKRLNEARQSRDNWKQKYQELKADLKRLRQENEELKKNEISS